MTEIKKIATRDAYGKALAELAKENSNIFVMDADLSQSTKSVESVSYTYLAWIDNIASWLSYSPESIWESSRSSSSRLNVAAAFWASRLKLSSSSASSSAASASS